MALGDFYLPQQWVTTTSGSGNAYLWNGGYTITAGGGAGSSSASFAPPEPRKATAMDWLDGEVENVCKLARQVG